MNRILWLIGVVLVVGSLYWFSGGPPPDGPYETYHDNGQLEVKTTYKDGEFDGPWEWYNENGQLWVKGTYKAGERDGAYEVYRENGQLQESGMYRAGERVGPGMRIQTG